MISLASVIMFRLTQVSVIVINLCEVSKGLQISCKRVYYDLQTRSNDNGINSVPLSSLSEHRGAVSSDSSATFVIGDVEKREYSASAVVSDEVEL